VDGDGDADDPEVVGGFDGDEAAPGAGVAGRADVVDDGRAMVVGERHAVRGVFIGGAGFRILGFLGGVGHLRFRVFCGVFEFLVLLLRDHGPDLAPLRLGDNNGMLFQCFECWLIRDIRLKK